MGLGHLGPDVVLAEDLVDGQLAPVEGLTFVVNNEGKYFFFERNYI